MKDSKAGWYPKKCQYCGKRMMAEWDEHYCSGECFQADLRESQSDYKGDEE
jgi:hypothetical protein